MIAKLPIKEQVEELANKAALEMRWMLRAGDADFGLFRSKLVVLVATAFRMARKGKEGG